MRRFWKAAAAVAAGDGWGVALDGKAVRTPAGMALVVPTRSLAEAIAVEWDAVDAEVKPAAMRLTGLANVAIDRAGAMLADQIAAYGETDLLCYRAEGPASLMARQRERWEPLIGWAEARYGVRFLVTTGIVHAPQPEATRARLAAEVGARSAWEQAGLHPVVTVTGSLVLGLAVLEGAISAGEAWEAGALDEIWQAEQWGEDSLAAAARADRRAAVDAGARLLALLR